MSHLANYNAAIRRNRRTQAANAVVPQGFEQTHRDLISYNGTFDLLLNLRNALTRYGKLTDKQWAAAAKCLAPKPQAQPLTVTVKCNQSITISANAARTIARQNKWPFNPRTLVVTEIKSVDHTTPRGFTVTVKIDWTGDAQDCRCCGKALTDWRSQATGVGPVCVKRTGIKYVTNQADVARFQKEMEALAQQLGEVEVHIKRWHITEGLSHLMGLVKAASPASKAVTKININNCTWNAAANLFIVELAKPHGADQIEVVNPNTNASRIFTRDGDNNSWYCPTGTGAPLMLVFRH